MISEHRFSIVEVTFFSDNILVNIHEIFEASCNAHFTANCGYAATSDKQIVSGGSGHILKLVFSYHLGYQENRIVDYKEFVTTT